jgi:hypothetical protein
MNEMIVIDYFNWKGTLDERKKYESEQKEKWAKIKGVKVLGVYTPTIAWNRAWVIETDSFDTLLKNSDVYNPHITNTDLVILL